MAERPLLLLVDLAALAFRSHYAFINRPITRSDGMVTSALFGMSNSILSVLQEFKPEYVLCALDTGEKNFRHEMYSEYKANRPPCPEDLGVQLKMQGEFCESFGLPWDVKVGFEADDLIGTYTTMAQQAGYDVLIYSGDKDFMQLLDEHTKMLITHRGGEQEVFTYDKVEGKLGVRPDQVVDYLSLLGDSSDNVPGAPGVGKVTASNLLKEHGTLEKVLEAAPNIKKKGLAAKIMDNREQIELSKRLVIIETQVPEVKSLESLAFKGIPLEKAKPFLEQMEFPRVLSRLQKAEQITEDVAEVDLEKVKYQSFNELKDFTRAIQDHSSNQWSMVLEAQEDKIQAIALSPAPGSALVYREIGEQQQSALMEALAPLKLTGFGLKSYLRTAMRLGMELNPIHDIELQSQILKPGKNFSLRELIEAEGTYKCMDLGKEGNRKRTFVDLSAEECLVYLGEQADHTHRIVEKLNQALEKQNLWEVYFKLERPLQNVIADMEQRGICLDVDILKSQEEEAVAELKQLTQTIHELAGEEFNINSTKQLGVILFEKLKIQDELGLKKVKKTKTGYSTDSHVLESIKAHPIGEALLRYRFLSKLNSTYLEALPKGIDPVTGRIHTTYHQSGTATGRLSSQNPNLQNIPMRVPEGARIREAFVASSSDKLIVSADYSQIELRILAYYSKDETMREAFMSDHDIHSATAAQVFGIAPEWVTKQQRSSAKAVNFGLLYGMGPRKLAQDTGLTFSEAQKFIRSYFESFSSIQKHMENQVQFARDHGYVTTLAGRHRSLPDLNSSNGMLRNAAENMALNTPIQGSAADIIKWAMLRLFKRIREEQWPVEMLLQVHDELVFEVDRNRVDEMMQIIKEEMEASIDLPEDFEIPLKVEIAKGKNWLESH
jgi:DNA polymerase-1